MHEDAHQHRVLDHIGEIAGVKGVAIIHGAKSCAQIHGCQSREAAAPRKRGFGSGVRISD
jgi:hypothetical protein